MDKKQRDNLQSNPGKVEMPRLANPEQALREYDEQFIPSAWYMTYNADRWMRSTEEVLREIDEEGNPFPRDQLRRFVMKAAGIKGTRNAENLVILGCVHPFLDPHRVRAYFQLLYLLGLEYNVLDYEYCCGAPLLGYADQKNPESVYAQIEGLNRRNIDMAREAGAKNVYYFCRACVGKAQRFVREGDPSLLFGLDILIEPLKKVSRLKAKPAKVGYYRGCWRIVTRDKPDIKFPFKTYRSWLDRIEGITVVDLRNRCCMVNDNPRAVIEEAVAAGVDYIVTPCVGCMSILNGRVEGRPVMTKMLHELLLESLVYKG